MAKMLSNRGIRKEINILLLGRSGTGKTTFVNSFANYVAYEKLENIRREDLIKCPIPATFVLHDDEGEEKIFKVGADRNQDGNESLDPLASGTRTCKAYKFGFEDLNINIIDTPGIVDTDGPEQDKENMRLILDFLMGYESIHGVCILLKPNESRSDAILRYCIFGLMSNLEKSAAENIVFVFTNARTTRYKLGSSSTAIKRLLKEIREKNPDVNIEFTKNNYFFQEGEAFQYLIARHEMEFSRGDKEFFAESWTRSREECVRMINHIMKLPAHSVQDTISINESRRLISVLFKPLEDIFKNISEYEELCKTHKDDLKDHQGTLEELVSKLYIPRRKLSFEYFDYPRLFCASEKCKKEVAVDEGSGTHYDQVCYQVEKEHIDYIAQYGVLAISAIASLVSPLSVALAAAIGVGAGAWIYYAKITCPQCNCLLADHMARYYETRIVTEQIIDEETQNKIHTTESAELAAQAILQKLEDEIEELSKERDEITAAHSKFAIFLKYRAITPYNDAFEDYLNFLIEAAKTKPGSSKGRARHIKSLRDMLKKHQDEKAFLEGNYTSAEDVDNIISPRDVVNIVNQLCKLKIHGQQIANAIHGHTTAQIAQQKYSTIDCNALALSGSGIVSTLTTFFHLPFDFD